MRNAIKEYLEYTDAEKSELWDNATFVFDTNVLLNLYRYSKDTRDALLKSMEQLKDRIWMPYNIAYEYMNNRAEIIHQVSERYESLKEDGKKFVDQCAQQLKMKKDSKDFEDLKKYLYDWIDEKKNKYYVSEKYTEDSILNRLLKIFDGKVGDAYIDSKLEEIKKEGKDRYSKKVPPGYKDFKKGNENNDNNMYGDLIIWYQIIDYASQKAKDIIFVTDDQKEDWWNKSYGKTIGPRIELRKEFINKTNRKFHMYDMANYIEITNDKSVDKYDESVINEVKTSKPIDEDFYKSKSKTFRVASPLNTSWLSSELKQKYPSILKASNYYPYSNEISTISNSDDEHILLSTNHKSPILSNDGAIMTSNYYNTYKNIHSQTPFYSLGKSLIYGNNDSEIISENESDTDNSIIIDKNKLSP